MSAISLKSITGITSITTPAGVDNQLTLHTNNTTERVKIDVAGNVHINNHLAVAGVSTFTGNADFSAGIDVTGNSTFVNDLDVDGHTNLDNVSIVGITTTTSNIEIKGNNKYLKLGASDQFAFVTAGAQSFITNSTGHLTSRSASYTWENYAGNTEYLRIASNGRVGINTDNPQTYLYSMGEIAAGDGNRRFIGMKARVIDGTPVGEIRTTFYSGASGSYPQMRFVTNDTERIRIDNNGLVGIGTGVPLNRLHVKGSNTVARFESTSSYCDIKLQNSSSQLGFIQYNGTQLRFFANSGSTPTVYIPDTKFGVNTVPSTTLHVKDTLPEIRLTSSDAALDQGDIVGKLSFETTDPTTPTGVGVVSLIEAYSATSNGSDYTTSIHNRAGAGGGETMIRLGNALGQMRFYTHDTGTGVERLRIDENGSVSIGDVATHGYAAHHEGDDLVIGGAGWRGMTIYGEDGGGVIQFADNESTRIGQILYNHGDDSMDFRVNGNVTRLSIESDGNIVIGSFTPVDTRNEGGIHIQPNHGISFKAYGSASDSRNWRIRSDDSAWGNLDFSVGDNNTTDIGSGAADMVLSLAKNHCVGINNNTPDQRLKISGNVEVNAYDSSGGSGGYYTSKGLIIGNAYDAGITGLTDDRNGIIWQERGLDLDFATNNILRMKVPYDGGLTLVDSTGAYHKPTLKIANQYHGRYGGSLVFTAENGSGTEYTTARIRAYGGGSDTGGQIGVGCGDFMGDGDKLRIYADGKISISPTGNSTSYANSLAVTIIQNGGTNGYPGLHLKSTSSGGGEGMSVVATDGNWDLYTRSGNENGLGILRAGASSSGNARFYLTNGGNLTVGDHTYTDLATSKKGHTMMHVAGGGLSVGPKGNHAQSTQGGRYVLGWYMTGYSSSHSYLHLITDLWAGGSPHNNSEYIMGGFHIHGHQYAGGSSVSRERIYFHNWGGSYPGYSNSNPGNWSPGNTVYTHSTGYVALRLQTGSYRGYIIDLIQHAWYPTRDMNVTSATYSNSTTL